jgi:hypothetical protein
VLPLVSLSLDFFSIFLLEICLVCRGLIIALFIKTYVSYEMLHQAKSKLFFCLMHMFELFEFELCWNLN